MHFLTLGHTIGTTVGRNLLNIRKDHYVAVLVIIVAGSVADVVIDRVPLLAAPIQTLAHGYLARFLSF